MKLDLEITYVYIIDSSLHMSKGKIAAQVSHVAMQLAEKYGCLGKAVVLKTDHNTFLGFSYLEDAVIQIDAGRTQVPEGTITCIGFKQTETIEKYTKHLTLL